MTDLMRIMDVQTAQATILRRPAWDEISVPDVLADGIAALFGERLTPDEVVRRILADVRQRGDAALLDWTQRLDRVQPVTLVVTRAQIEDAYHQISAETIAALQLAAQRIENFHRRQPALSWIHNDA